MGEGGLRVFKWFGGLNLFNNYFINILIFIEVMEAEGHSKQAFQTDKWHPSQSSAALYEPISAQPPLNDAPAPALANAPHSYPYPSYDQDEKVIPGYNFQSLFRKKSHIKLSRKKNREESAKRTASFKSEAVERESKNIQKGHWTEEESRLYHFFLEIHNRHFILKHLRRTDKIFKSMANFMKSREAEQCRSHHQKMEKKYHNFYQILIKLRMDAYSSLSAQEVAQDLELRGFKIEESSLIGEEDLRNGDMQFKEIKEERCDPLDSEEEEPSQENDNILSENYENDLDFNKMHFEP